MPTTIANTVKHGATYETRDTKEHSLTQAILAVYFFRIRNEQNSYLHVVGKREYADPSRDYIRKARQNGWRGSVREAIQNTGYEKAVFRKVAA